MQLGFRGRWPNIVKNKIIELEYFSARFLSRFHNKHRNINSCIIETNILENWDDKRSLSFIEINLLGFK